jgi:hypothetical protein
VPALAGGARTRVGDHHDPGGNGNGTWNVFMRAPTRGVVSETYENNNLTSRSLKIGPT